MGRKESSPLPGCCKHQERPWSARLLPLGLLAACLALLVSTIALGVCYWQEGQRLQQAWAAHAAERDGLGQLAGAQEQRLGQAGAALARAQEELAWTRAELVRAWHEGNRSQEKLEETRAMLARAQGEAQDLRQELNKTATALASARPCQVTGSPQQGRQHQPGPPGLAGEWRAVPRLMHQPRYAWGWVCLRCLGVGLGNSQRPPGLKPGCRGGGVWGALLGWELVDGRGSWVAQSQAQSPALTSELPSACTRDRPEQHRAGPGHPRAGGRPLGGDTERDLGASGCLCPDCCPETWVLHRGKCLFFSKEEKTWLESKQACERESSRLLISWDWDRGTMPSFLARLETPYWIGLRWRWEIRTEEVPWQWEDDTPYTSSESAIGHGLFGIIKRGSIEKEGWYNDKHPWVCEKPARRPQEATRAHPGR